MNTKTCTKCQKTLLLDNFWRAGNNLRSECRQCSKTLKDTRSRLKKEFKSAPTDHLCPICLRTESQSKGKGGNQNGSWVLDHNHKTTEFRGWLCHKCNRGLGSFNDCEDTLRRAFEYLVKNSLTNTAK